MNSKYLFCSASLNLSLSQKKNFSLRHSLVGADGWPARAQWQRLLGTGKGRGKGEGADLFEDLLCTKRCAGSATCMLSLDPTAALCRRAMNPCFYM